MKRIKIVAWTALVLCAALLIAWRLTTGWSFFFAAPPHGEILGVENGVEVRANASASVRGEYGLEYECVELINRYYVQILGHRNMTRTGHADSYYWSAHEKGLAAYPNGGSTRPEIHDILVFDWADDDGSVGHVAVVVDVDLATGSVTFIQQNMTVRADGGLFRREVWMDTLPLRSLNNGWTVEQGHYNIPVAGWARVAPPARRSP
jgi:hypothetical protein